MKNFSIIFTNPWFFVLLIPLITCTIIPYLRLPKSRRRIKSIYIPVILRIAALIIIICLLSGLNVITGKENITTIVLADLSDSTLPVRDKMSEYVSEIAKSSKQSGEVGIIAFADNCIYEAEITDNCKFSSFSKKPVSEASNIDEALKYANSQLDNNKNGRIILLSDGKENKGDACKSALTISNSNLRVDAVYFDTESSIGNEMLIDNITLPSSIAIGESIDINVSIKSNCNAKAKLTLYDGDRKIAEQSIDIEIGHTKASFNDIAKISGIHNYTAKISSSDDTIAQNNMMSSYIKVKGNERILIVDKSGTKASYLSTMLKENYEIEIKKPGDVSTSINDLKEYKTIILMNVNNNDLPTGCDIVLEEYVSKAGGSILTTGGDSTYHNGNMEQSKFKDMLPVNIDLDSKDKNRSEALMILIDSSSSMTGEYIETAKKAAIDTINTLDENASVGVIAFSRNINIVSELTTIKNKDEVIKKVENLQTTMGTYLYDAVYEASQELANSTADVKHMIILSDGTPRDIGYSNVVSSMYASGVTTSTILIGYEGNTEILSNLAQLGGGRFYNVYDIGELDDTMLDESKHISENYINIGDYELRISDYSKVLKDIDKMPNVKGYVSAKIKTGASNVLYTGNNSPIYAEWRYGSGKVAAFTSDLTGEWSKNLCNCTIGQKFILNICESLVTAASSDDIKKASSYSKEYDVFEKGGYERLSSICNVANGSIFKDTTSLLNIRMREEKSSRSFYFLLSILALILLITDLSIRNIKWESFKRFIGICFSHRKKLVQ